MAKKFKKSENMRKPKEVSSEGLRGKAQNAKILRKKPFLCEVPSWLG